MIALYHRDLGGEGNPPLVLLHGLLGSSRNWLSAGRALAEDFHTLAVDLRNHGQSPHTEEHNYPLMTDDLLRWLDGRELDKIHLIGHSMGGKAAMHLACRHPDRVSSLVVVDIAPRAKEPSHREEFRALQALSLGAISSRAEADLILAQSVASWPMRQFLLTNLIRHADGSWRWQMNLEGLARNLAETGHSPVLSEDRFHGPALWIVGGKSDFVQPEDHRLIREHFPRARIEILAAAAHNPHVEDRPRFVEEVRTFLRHSRESEAAAQVR
jgi:esterase